MRGVVFSRSKQKNYAGARNKKTTHWLVSLRAACVRDKYGARDRLEPARSNEREILSLGAFL